MKCTHPVLDSVCLLGHSFIQSFINLSSTCTLMQISHTLVLSKTKTNWQNQNKPNKNDLLFLRTCPFSVLDIVSYCLQAFVVFWFLSFVSLSFSPPSSFPPFPEVQVHSTLSRVASGAALEQQLPTFRTSLFCCRRPFGGALFASDINSVITRLLLLSSPSGGCTCGLLIVPYIFTVQNQRLPLSFQS